MPLVNSDRLPTHRDQPVAYRLVQRSGLDSELQEFIIDRQARNLTPKTIRWHEQSLAHCRFTPTHVGKTLS